LAGNGNREKQRERLLAAIVHVGAERGYEDTTIARVIERARVSRSTFYEHFPSKEECSLAALADLETRVLAEVADNIRERPPKDAAAAAIAALLALAERYPSEVRFLANEAMAAGPRALDARDRGIELIAGLIEDAHRSVNEATPIPTVPAGILIGSVHRVLAARLLLGETGLPALQEDLLGWVAAYAEPARVKHWDTLTRSPAPARVHFPGQAPMRSTLAAPPGRPQRSVPTIAERHRQRIVLATAEILQRGGYAATTVAQITRAAGVDGRVFYRLFADKRDAFRAVHELAFQRTMAVTAGAFFTAEDWPRRIWQAGGAFTQYVEQNAALTHASLIEAHAGGREAVERLGELVAGFTIFLQEGYEHRPTGHGSPPSPLALEAIAQANFEILYRQARASASADMAGQLPRLAYVCLAPFVGPVRAGELIVEMMRE
jgi:AcrR family transcriptional regulator